MLILAISKIKHGLFKDIGEMKSEFAYVCPPQVHQHWLTTTDFLTHNIVSPATHVMSMACLLVTAIIYFIMPTLRDLTGNIVTTICVCLIISQAADMIRLLTVFKSHISLLIAGKSLLTCGLFLF